MARRDRVEGCRPRWRYPLRLRQLAVLKPLPALPRPRDAQRPSDVSAGDLHLGIFGPSRGEDFAFLVVACPLLVNLLVLCGPECLHRAAVPLLMAAQASLVIADHRRLARTNTRRTALPSLWWALFPLGWLYLRKRLRTSARPFAGIWCLASLPLLLPFISLVATPDWKHVDGVHHTDAVVTTVFEETHRHPPPRMICLATGSSIDAFVQRFTGRHSDGSCAHAIDTVTGTGQ